MDGGSFVCKSQGLETHSQMNQDVHLNMNTQLLAEQEHLIPLEIIHTLSTSQLYIQRLG